MKSAPPATPVNGFHAGHLDISVNIRAIKGKGDKVGEWGEAKEGYILIHTPDYIGGTQTKLPEFESRPYHLLAVQPWASHLTSLVE